MAGSAAMASIVECRGPFWGHPFWYEDSSIPQEIILRGSLERSGIDWTVMRNEYGGSRLGPQSWQGFIRLTIRRNAYL